MFFKLKVNTIPSIKTLIKFKTEYPEHISLKITQHLFQDVKNETNKTCGLDLVTLNLQRGRDHGLPGYAKWRVYCNLSHVKSFSDLYHIMDKDSVYTLKKYYKSVEDIDLYSGALSEIPVENAILGPTATCLIAKQFHKLKFGDRYWYETSEQPQGFTKEQLTEIKKTTLSKIICDNSDSIEFVRKYVMETMEGSTDQIECDSLEEINLEMWSDSHRHPGHNLEQNKVPKPSVIKLYASISLIAGEIFGSYDNGEVVKLFDGTLPAKIYVDNFTDPNGYDVSANIEWQGVAVNNSLSGLYSIPVIVESSLNTAVKHWKGNFTGLFSNKWGSSLDIIIEPNNTYKCKLMFNDFNKKATMTLKGKTEKDPESCTIMLAGYFYTKPFYCILTPWWCTNENVFYWPGDAELIIRKLAENATDLDKFNYEIDPIHKQENDPKISRVILDGEPLIIGPKKDDSCKNTFVNKQKQTIEGKTSNGYVDVHQPNKLRIWNGSLPVEIHLPMFWQPDPNMKNLYDNYTHDIVISCSFFQSSIQGNFKLPRYTKFGLIEWTIGTFSFQVTPLKHGTFYDIIMPDVEYYSSIYFHDIHKEMSILHVRNRRMNDRRQQRNMKILILGKYNSGFTKTFTWNGDFYIIVDSTYRNDKIPLD